MREFVSLGRRAPWVIVGAMVLLAGCSARQATVDCAGNAAYADVALAEGIGLCSSAGSADAQRIETLLGGSEGADGVAELVVDYPIEGTIVPPELAPPTFLWHDPSESADAWIVDATFGPEGRRLSVLVPGAPPPRGEIDPQCVSNTNKVYEPTPYQASAISWRPSTELWAALKQSSVGTPVTLRFMGYRSDVPDRIVSRGEVTLTTSEDPLGAPIFYRDVPLMPSATKDGVIKPLDQASQPLIAWRLKDISRDDSRVMLNDMPTCANCHSFSHDGSTMGMDIDGPTGDKGAYAVAAVKKDLVIDDDQIMTWNAFKQNKPKGLNTLGFLSRVSPDGRYVVSTVNESLFVQNFWNHEFIQVFYPTGGILAFYDRETGEIHSLPGADDPAYVHCDAVWSPDGKWLVFARAKAKAPYEPGRPRPTYAGDPNETPIQYDLYRMPFDEGRGGEPEPVEGASFNGMSNSFPKISPDGKWIVWVQAKNGQLMRPDSRLWIVPFEGGEARELASNKRLMNSWHSFSPNGRWMVFSSKSDSPYTDMYLTHLDENGNASPPVLVENTKAANRAVNIPEFVNVAYDQFTSIRVPAVHHYEYFERGNELARAGHYQEAIAEFERALEGRKREWSINDWRIHDSLSKVLMRVGRDDEALEHIRAALEINPFNPDLQTNLGYILAERGQTDEALAHFDKALEVFPGQGQAWYNRATVRLQTGDAKGARDDFSEALRLAPDWAEAHTGRGMALRILGDHAAARADFDEAIRLDPRAPAPLYFRALSRQDDGDVQGAMADLDQAASVAQPGSHEYTEIQAAREKLRSEI